VLILAAAAILASNSLLQAPAQTAPTQTATVRVAVANVWEAPNAGHLPLDPHVWPTPQVTYAQRIALVGKMPTQVLYGERVEVLERRSGWAHIYVPDQPSPLDARGYPGWVRSWQIGPALEGPKSQVTVTARTTKLLDGDEVSFGTQLPMTARRGKLIAVVTPRGGTFVRAADVRPLPRTRADIVRSAKMFLGLHYLWGGLSAWGYDCSGLTWAVYRAHGITIPRDADAQFAAGTPVALAEVQPGDLLFYESPIVGHVSMALGNGQMIEAPNSRSEVRIVPVRTADFRGARRFF
jgi:cell wall-associated NlpC family hydrolase